VLERDDLGEFQSTLDAGDAARDYVDIERVRIASASQPHWWLMLAGVPPTAPELDAKEAILSYGLAFETDGDGSPDYVVGISNEASQPGGFLVWVTDLATGETEEQDGPPYGYPVEFSHPSEVQGVDGRPALEMLFTFLNESRPPGVALGSPFYAWASVEEDGEVVAWDYAPDEGWAGAPRAEAGADEAAVITPAPIPPGLPAALTAYPECYAEAFDFAGRGTLRGLGLHEATPVAPPDIDRPATIWVTRDLMPQDVGPPGGEVRMTRMLCWEFDDGRGFSGWPVDASWQPPAASMAASGDESTGGPPPFVLALALVALLAVAGAALAFRERRR
jgi:hypothetical protein